MSNSRFSRTLLCTLLGVGAVVSSALAQESELDRLSRTSDNPFADIVASQAREPVSVTLRALDKITARYIDIDAPMNELAHFGSLEIIPRFCDKRPPEEFPETTAFLEIFDIRKNKAEAELTESTGETAAEGGEAIADEMSAVDDAATLEVSPMRDSVLGAANELRITGTGEKIFSGWMFASSPALNSLEHGVYDVWVIDCKTVPLESSSGTE